MIDPLPKHSTVAIFGLGSSGIAAAQLLASFGKNIIASDTANESKRDEFLAKLPTGTQLVLGHNEIGNATVIVTSPGLEPASPIFCEAQSRNIPILAELELSFRATQIPLVAITGTDGKTTTTTLTSHLLNTCHITNKMGGNVGIPLSQVIQESPEPQRYVVETSAFQLVFCPDLRPHILIATNIAEDHSEYFKGDWNRYVETKRRPLLNMHPDDIAILNASDPEIRHWNQFTKAKCAWYAMNISDIPQNATHYACISKDEIHFQFGDAIYKLALTDLKLKGIHNAMNTMASIMACLFEGCSFDDAIRAIDSYQLPPHRIQSICSHKNVEFIDDSKATNPHAGMAALTTVDRPTVLIVGGVDKGLSLTEWIKMMDKNVHHIMVIGALSDRFCNEAMQCHIHSELHRCTTLEEAVLSGYKLALRDKCQTVMLSPGCSSYDMFKSYGQRGDCFAKAAREIEE